MLRGADPTPAADIYAIGMLLRVLATGSFAGELAADADEPSRRLEKIWQRCVQPDPSARFLTANMLIEELERIGVR